MKPPVHSTHPQHLSTHRRSLPVLMALGLEDHGRVIDCTEPLDQVLPSMGRPPPIEPQRTEQSLRGTVLGLVVALASLVITLAIVCFG